MFDKNQHIVHIWFTPSEGPKGFMNYFLKKSDHGSWTIKSDQLERPSSTVQLREPWCKSALRARSRRLKFPSIRLFYFEGLNDQTIDDE